MPLLSANPWAGRESPGRCQREKRSGWSHHRPKRVSECQHRPSLRPRALCLRITSVLQSELLPCTVEMEEPNLTAWESSAHNFLINSVSFQTKVVCGVPLGSLTVSHSIWVLKSLECNEISAIMRAAWVPDMKSLCPTCPTYPHSSWGDLGSPWICLWYDARGAGLIPAQSHTLLSLSPRHVFLSKYRNVKKVIHNRKQTTSM